MSGSVANCMMDKIGKILMIKNVRLEGDQSTLPRSSVKKKPRSNQVNVTDIELSDEGEEIDAPEPSGAKVKVAMTVMRHLRNGKSVRHRQHTSRAAQS